MNELQTNQIPKWCFLGTREMIPKFIFFTKIRENNKKKSWRRPVLPDWKHISDEKCGIGVHTHIPSHSSIGEKNQQSRYKNYKFKKWEALQNNGIGYDYCYLFQ